MSSKKIVAASVVEVGLFIQALLVALKVTQPIKAYWKVPGTQSTLYDFAAARGITKAQVDALSLPYRTASGYIVAHLPERGVKPTAPVSTVATTLKTLGL